MCIRDRNEEGARTDPHNPAGPILFATTLAPGMSVARGLFMELFLTCMLLLTM